MTELLKKRKNIILLTSIIAIGGIIRVIGVVNWQGFSFDEIISASIASQPWNELWGYLKWEMHPPLHFVLIKIWSILFGESETTLRMSSVLFGTISVWGMYLLGSELYKSKSAGIIAAFFATINPNLIYRSMIARMYGPLVFFAIMATYFLHKALFNSSKKSYWLGFGIMFWTTMYTHLTAIVLLVVFPIYVFWLQYKKLITLQAVKRFAITFGIVTATYVPWIWYFVFIRLPDMPRNAWYLFAKQTDLFFLVIPTKLFFVEASSFVAVIGFIVIAGLITIGLVRITKSGEKTWSIINITHSGSMLAVLMLAGSIIMPFMAGLHPFRYYTLASIAIILLVSGGLVQTKSLFPNTKAATLAILLLTFAVLPESLSQTNLTDLRWPAVMNYIKENEQPNDVIVGAFKNDLVFFEYYYDGALERKAIHTTPEQLSDNTLLTIVRTNAYQYVTEESINQLKDITSGKNRVFFVASEHLLEPQRKLYKDWFKNNGWYEQDKFVAGGLTNPQVTIMSRDE